MVEGSSWKEHSKEVAIAGKGVVWFLCAVLGGDGVKAGGNREMRGAN